MRVVSSDSNASSARGVSGGGGFGDEVLVCWGRVWWCDDGDDNVNGDGGVDGASVITVLMELVSWCASMLCVDILIVWIYQLVS